MEQDLGTTGFVQHDGKYFGIYRGKVLDNNDTSKLGRIKIQVYPMFAGITDSTLLPWAKPAYPIWEGSGSGIGYFAVPDNNTFVFVFFEQGDIYQPVYFAEAPTATMGLPTDRITNYPNRKVLKTSGGIIIYVDDTSKEVKLTHPTGTFILIDTTGKITINAVDDTLIESTTQINIIAPTINIVGSTAVNINPI